MAGQIPGFLLTAPGSGCGKTLLTCGILSALIQQGHHPISYKCGPDYIDPMFHQLILGIPSRNLDIWLMGETGVLQCLAKTSTLGDVLVLEGAMGYYDGIGGTSTDASAYAIASLTDMPAVLVVDTRGRSVSLLAEIKGFLEYQAESQIKGVLFNHCKPMQYARLQKMVETELDIPVCGFLPELEELQLENLQLKSRHLGLVMPEELPEVRQQFAQLGKAVAETVDLEKLVQLGTRNSDRNQKADERPEKRSLKKSLTIACARDEAFSFFYQDNLDRLEERGVTVRFFSPIHDQALPEDVDGLLLYGGYPELHAKKLSENRSMRTSIKEALVQGLPCMAECGGFLYLQESLKDAENQEYPMVGYLTGKSHNTGHLTRFGYVSLEDGWAFGEQVPPIHAHEFHYYDSTHPGTDFTAKKAAGDRTWPCMVSTRTIFAGFPHIHYGGNPELLQAFVKCCSENSHRPIANR